MKTLALALGLAVVCGSPAFAQPTDPTITPPTTTTPPTITTPPTADDADTRCQTALATRSSHLSPAHNCAALAEAIVTKVLHSARKTDVNTNQPSITDTPGGQASTGQTAAVASGQPVGSVGGSVAAVGATGQGLQLVTALAINPGTIVTGDTEERTLWLSRAVDLSLVLPLNVDPGEGVKKGFAYVGGRLRVDLIPLIRREWLAKTLNASLKKAQQQYEPLQIETAKKIPKITSLLTAASDAVACAKALEANDADAEVTACGESVDFSTMTLTGTAARTALAEFREQADRGYLSLEARGDRGDLNADGASAKDTLMAAYLAGGYAFRSSSDGANFSLRGRAGAVFFEDGMTKATKTAWYAAAGIELAVVRDLQRYAFTAGFELYSKHVTDDPMLALEERNAVRLGFAVPLADGKTVSVGVLIPTDSGDPTITVSGDWSLLLGR